MGSYSHNNPANRMRARRLLESMMDEARKEAAKGGLEQGHASHLFENMARYLDEDKLDGVHIYPAPLGGWHADVSFKDMPTGMPPIIGTPKALPCKTREEAVKAVKGILAIVAGIIRNNATASPPEEKAAAFEIDGITLYVPVGLLDVLRSKGGLPSKDYVLNRLNEVRKKYGTNGRIGGEAIETLDDEGKRELQVVAAMALLSGFVRWPETMDMPPAPGVMH